MILLWLSVFHKNMDMRLITNVYFGHISINDYQSRFLPKGWKKVGTKPDYFYLTGQTPLLHHASDHQSGVLTLKTL